jgi:hypothetical protein
LEDGDIGNDVWAGVRGEDGEDPNDTEGARRWEDIGEGTLGDELEEAERNRVGGTELGGGVNELFENKDPRGLGGISKFVLKELALGGVWFNSGRGEDGDNRSGDVDGTKILRGRLGFWIGKWIVEIVISPGSELFVCPCTLAIASWDRSRWQ